MDPAKLPLPSACGVSDGASASSAACGTAMQALCSGGYANPNNHGIMQSMLLNPDSNCSNWMTAIQTTDAVLGTAPGTPSLDAAMRAYCLGDGSLTQECSCLAFPLTASAWCANAATDCPHFGSESCAAQEFAQAVDGGSQLNVIQFTTCNPYYCWMSSCYETPQTQLVTSDILASQSTQGACAGVCGQFVQEASMSIAPMPPGSFAPAANMVDNESQIGACGVPTKPAMLTSSPQTWEWPTNGIMSVPFYVTNDGDYPAQVSITSASLGSLCTLRPNNSIVFGRSAQQFAITCDQPLVAAMYTASASYDPQVDPQGPPSLTLNPQFELTYMDLVSGKSITTAPMGITAVVLPAASPLVVPAVPWWGWLACGALAALILIQIVFLTKSKRALNLLMSTNGLL